ncbi:MAG: hypothetical protein KC414_10245, partial [Romboutsia sp.]|nr:hypothetical protein [Romboutsia sp.]
RNAYENSGLLRSFDPLYESIKSSLEDKNIKDVKEIFDIFRQEGEGLLKEVYSRNIFFLRKLIKVGQFNSSFIYGIERIRKWGDPFDISKGADYVEGTFHHLPLYITFSNLNDDYQKRVYSLIELVLTRSIHYSTNLINELEGILEIMNSSRLDELDKVEINLIKALVFMIIPSRNVLQKVKENDTIANAWLSELEIPKEEKEASANRDYLRIWSLRRIGRYKESVKLAKSAIKKHPKDPRFYHGLFLSLYCISEENKNQDVTLLRKLLSYLDKSLELYYEFTLENYSNQRIFPVIMDSIEESYLNSYCYCSSLLANTLNKATEIGEFKELMVSIRKKFSGLKDEENRFYN